MPSAKPLPTQNGLLTSFGNAIIGRDAAADLNRGSLYEAIGAASAIQGAREARRDRDLYRATFLTTARGADLEALGERTLGIARTRAAAGVGTASLVRASGATSGTIYRGTRVRVRIAGGVVFYETSADVSVAAGALVATVPVRATVMGSGTAISILSPAVGQLAIEDPLFDVFQCASLVCSDGTDEQSMEDCRAALLVARRSNRPGTESAVVQAILRAGVTQVVAFESSALGPSNDSGIQAVYVGDATGNGTPALVATATLAAESARVLGAPLFVGRLQVARLTIQATLELDDVPGGRNVDLIKRIATGALVSEFGSAASHSYRLTALAGAILDACPNVRGVTFTSPATEPSLTSLSLPAVLTLWQIDPAAVTFDVVGPQ